MTIKKLITTDKSPNSSLPTKEDEELASLIDAQLDEIVCGGFSRTIFDKIKPS